MAGILTLASASPRRRELLEALGIALEVRPAGADETQLPGEPARAYVARVAAEKARAVDGALVLAADTAVVVDGAVLGKPASPDDARRMLRALSGRDHAVMTGVCLRVRGGPERALVVSSAVRFAALTASQIDWYVATGEPLDKAGAYAVQGLGGAFVREVDGSVTNIVGLPLAETLALLAEVGYLLPWSAP
ncbi:MAG TPA: Maf family protein [Anaeromyxobacteraceae bacterium]|jgi:septum formation protein|nr:Maf family protein [Anaeromyxobacteraceae bacterium]